MMYKCNLSYKLLEQYLRETLKAELICPEENENCCTMTERGRMFLDKFEEHLDHSKRLRQEADKINHERELLESMTRDKDIR